MSRGKKRPSGAMVVACLAMFVALGGTSIAAVGYARNAGKVDGKNAFKSSRSNDKVAGGLVATYPGGRLKGKLAHRFLGDTPKSKPFAQQVDVTDGNAAGAEHSLVATSAGWVDFTCDDGSPAAGVEQPVSRIRFESASTAPSKVVGRVGNGPAVVGADGKATLTVSGTDTFEFIAGPDAANQVLIEGVFQQTGAGTADAKCGGYGTGIEIHP